MKQPKYILEVWKAPIHGISKAEKVSTKEYPFPTPILPVGTTFLFGNQATKVIDVVVEQNTVQVDGGEWVPIWKQAIVVEFI